MRTLALILPSAPFLSLCLLPFACLSLLSPVYFFSTFFVAKRWEADALPSLAGGKVQKGEKEKKN